MGIGINFINPYFKRGVYMDKKYYKLESSGTIRLVDTQNISELQRLENKGFNYHLDTAGRKKQYNSNGRLIKSKIKVEDDFK